MKRKLNKLFKYVILATLLTGNTLAMENQIDDVCGYIVQLSSMQDRRSLAQTCWRWNQVAQPFLKTPFCNFEQININLPSHISFRGEFTIHGCTPDSFCIFLPFQENGETEKATEWHQTTPWCINGYTGKAQQLPTFDGEINNCTFSLHPGGIVLPDWKDHKYPNFLKIQDGTLQKQPVFQNMPEAENLCQGDTFACTSSKLAFVHDQMLSCYNLLSCHDLKDAADHKSTVLLEAVNLSIFNFKDKFLVHGNTPESLWIINPEMDTLIEKAIALPEGLSYCHSTSDGDNLVISGTLNQQYDQPRSHFLIEHVSSDHPTTSPLVFLPEGYDAVSVYLKNNYVFSIGSIMDNLAGKDHSKSSVFVIYDLEQKRKCFQKFMPGFQFFGNLVGTTLFFGIALGGDCALQGDVANTSETKSLMGISLKNWL